MLGKYSNLNKNHRSIGGLIIASMCSHTYAIRTYVLEGNRIRKRH